MLVKCTFVCNERRFGHHCNLFSDIGHVQVYKPLSIVSVADKGNGTLSAPYHFLTPPNRDDWNKAPKPLCTAQDFNTVRDVLHYLAFGTLTGVYNSSTFRQLICPLRFTVLKRGKCAGC